MLEGREVVGVLILGALLVKCAIGGQRPCNFRILPHGHQQGGLMVVPRLLPYRAICCYHHHCWAEVVVLLCAAGAD
eukprot:800917-Pelagomonas_calceolata.AAC.2